MRGAGAILVAVGLSGCMSVKLQQRDGCWVRRTERMGHVQEELGPCSRPAPAWSNDRITRIVQECVAQADYRWQARALEAWEMHSPIPERPPEGSVLTECMDASVRSTLSENEHLADRVREVSGERDALRSRADDDRTHLLASFDRIAGDLGEAVKKPAAPATATATARSDGSATSDGSAASDGTAAAERVRESTRESTPTAGAAVRRPAPVCGPEPTPRVRKAVRRGARPAALRSRDEGCALMTEDAPTPAHAVEAGPVAAPPGPASAPAPATATAAPPVPAQGAAPVAAPSELTAEGTGARGTSGPSASDGTHGPAHPPPGPAPAEGAPAPRDSPAARDAPPPRDSTRDATPPRDPTRDAPP